MTANRWWVQLAARWIARVDGVSGQLRLAFLAMTGNGIVLSTLKDYGYGEYAVPFLLVSAVGLLAYTWLYTEGGVWNQVARDRQDMSTNFAGPTMLMDDTLIGIAQFVAVNGRKPDAEEVRMIQESVRETWDGYREGVSLDGDR